MIGVVLHLPESEDAARQWEYALCHFAPDVIYLVGSERPEGFVYQNVVLIDDSSDLPPSSTLVLLAPLTGRIVQGDVSLADFVHPADAIYWFGPNIAEHMDPSVYMASRAPDHVVYVPTDSDDQMYAWTVYAVVAWDRRAKSV